MLNCFKLLNESNLLAQVLPEVEEMKGVQQSLDHHPEGDVFTHTMLVCENLVKLYPDADLALRLAALFHDVGKSRTHKEADGRHTFFGHEVVGASLTDEILTRMKFSKDVITKTVALVRDHMKFMSVDKMKVSTLRRFLSSDYFEDKLKLHHADCMGSSKNLTYFNFVKEAQAKYSDVGVRPVRIVEGRDLIALGFKPSKEFGTLLEELENEQLEGRITTYNDALQYLRVKYPN